MNRREFLLTTGMAALAAQAEARSAPPVAIAPPLIEARPGRQRLIPAAPQTPIWGYGGRVPGAMIRAAQGARLTRRLLNGLAQATTIHWHGIRIDNAMDGVPGLTQDAVPPGGEFDYDFTLPDAGTFWYHAHNRSMRQVARGLYGPLIVDEPSAPDVDRDSILMLDDWRLEPATATIRDDFDNPHDLARAGRIGNTITVNGGQGNGPTVRRHQRLRLRLINAANARIFRVGLRGLSGWVMALDGMPLAHPEPLRGSLRLAPAQRADLFVDVITGPGEPAGLTRDHGRHLLYRLPVTGRDSRARRGAPAPLPPNPLPEFGDPAQAPLHRLEMRGGAMRNLPQSRLGSVTMGAEELALLGKYWSFNGVVGLSDTPFLDVARGEVHRIVFVNRTAFGHAMHLHGHHFRVLGANGRPGPWRDTILVQPGATQQVALACDNPGRWLLHCHMLGHASAGMMTWINVE